ncbi:MAG: alpha/beta hydrolase, partial [Burkholderiales bacterium]
MKRTVVGRRDLLLTTAAAALAGAFASVGHAAAFVGRAAAKASYDPEARFKLTVSEVEFRRTAKGTPLLARIYQPVGPGPFPVILDLHGGGWNEKDREAEELFDRKMAVPGALVVAIDYTLAPEAPYPACIQDANYAIRWLKANASKWNGDASKIGVFGSSSGGHIAQLLMMRPKDPRYGALPFPEHPELDATIDYVIARSPASDVFAMYEKVVELKNPGLADKMKLFFMPWETIHEANPREILDRREAVTLKPLLVMQGALDDNVPTEAQDHFVKSFRAAGGQCDYTVFPDSDHQWVSVPGP